MLERFIDVAKLRAIFAGGGTGGHLFPAISIADELKKLEPESEILFIGTKDKIEARVVPQKGYRIKHIWISGFHRSLRFSNVLFPLKVIMSLMQAYSIIKNFKPDVVIGTGGYVSGPVLKVATWLNIPTLIQEQNSCPGVTTRMLARRVDEVHLTFESTRKYLQQASNIFITGNPTRLDLETVNRSDAINYFGFNARESNKTLLVFGGSLGAHTINRAIMKNINLLIQNNLRVIWQTGKEDYQSALESAKVYPRELIWINAFIDRMDYAYAVSDFVLCRAGATTIAELTRLGKPAILVPYPHAAANHQYENAKTLAEVGAAEIILDHELEDKFMNSVIRLLDDIRLHEMREQSKKLGKPNAAKELALRAIQLAVQNKSKQE